VRYDVKGCKVQVGTIRKYALARAPRAPLQNDKTTDYSGEEDVSGRRSIPVMYSTVAAVAILCLVLCWTCRAALFPPLSAFHRVHSHSYCTHTVQCSDERGPRNDAALGLEGQGWRWAVPKVKG
jgi:hypothetical protein